jgi:hypothetical protein
MQYYHTLSADGLIHAVRHGNNAIYVQTTPNDWRTDTTSPVCLEALAINVRLLPGDSFVWGDNMHYRPVRRTTEPVTCIQCLAKVR